MNAKQNGTGFENVFEAMCRALNVAITRFPDGCRRVKNNLVPVPTPCDWLVTHKGKTGFFDTKSSDGHSFPYSKITPHQVYAMAAHEHHGAKAGYVILLKKADTVIFVPASDLCNIHRSSIDGSINASSVGIKVLGSLRFFDIRLVLSDNHTAAN